LSAAGRSDTIAGMVVLAAIPEPERTVIAELECPRFADTPMTAPAPRDERHVALISTAGFIVRGERPLLARDGGYRAIRGDVADTDILCSHASTNFDRSGFQQDLNVMLPRDRLRELAAEGEIGAAADTHYAFMGATHPATLEDKAHELGGKLLALGVNTVVLAPV
jgi:D-proline reductase (dithiol) PrdB